MGNVEVVQALLSHGANVNAAVKDGRTALYGAAFQGNVEVVQALLSHGGEVNACDHLRRTPLFAALMSGKLEVVEVLLKHGANAEALDKTGNPAIFCTANIMSGDMPHGSLVEVIKLLMSNGGDPNSTNSVGENLLVHFLNFAREVVEKMDESSLQSLFMAFDFLIIECKSDVNLIPLSCGHSVIHLILLLLRHILQQEFESKDSVLKPNTTENCLKFLSSILSRCSKTLMRSKDYIGGNTPLHIWASLQWQSGKGSTKEVTPNTDNTECPIETTLSKIAEQLLFHGGKVNVANDDGETPLHLAQTWNAVKLLLTNKALPNARDIHGNTPLLSRVNKIVDDHLTSTSHLPLHELYNNMKSETLQTQWEGTFHYGMNPLKASDEGSTVLSALLKADAHHLIQALLEVTKAPSSQRYQVDSNGNTPLHTICRDVGEAHFWKLALIDDLVKSEASIVNCPNRKGQTALHILCQSEVRSKLICEVIQQLRKYSARTDIADDEGKTCLDIAADKPELMRLLTQDINILEIKPWLPWSSKSERHKNVLAEVARGRNSRQTGSLHYHVQTPIGQGAFGFVYAGVDSKDGREVALKKITKAQMSRPEGHREIENLVGLSDCEHVVQYLHFHQDQDFLYIVLELMEGTLTELMDGKFHLKKEEVISLCRDVVSGLMFLHQKGVKHRDIKTGNILYKCIPKLSLKLADFGLSSSRDASISEDRSVMHSKAGTRCWMAPELLLRGTAEHSKASDMFACGLLLHYLLSGKKHPFGPENEAGKSDHVVKHETEENILQGRLTIAEELNHEARHLVTQFLDSNKEERPSASEALKHPFFWSDLKKAAFLKEVGNQPEIGRPWHSKSAPRPPSCVEQDLEDAFKSQLSIKPWDTEIPLVYAEMTSRRSYANHSAVDLLRMFRNAHAHLPELSLTAKENILEKQVFFEKFPTLVIDVYNAVKTNGWDTRKEIAAVMNAT